MASSASGFSLRNWVRSEIQPRPMAPLMVRASGGLASNSQRRGATPFVLLLKRSGKIAARSATTVVLSKREWISATPLVLWVPTMARLAMRTFRCGASWIRLTRATRPSSPGNRIRTSWRKRRLIS